MVGTLVLTSGALCVGWGIYQQLDRQSTPKWWTNVLSRLRSVPLAQHLKPTTVATSTDAPLACGSGERKRVQRKRAGSGLREMLAQEDLLTSATLFGVVAIGGAGLFSLKYVAVPLLAYRTIPALSSTLAWIEHDRRAALGLLETTALAVIFINGAWVAGSTGFAVYHLGRWFVSANPKGQQAELHGAFRVRRDDQEITLSADHLQPGDRISIPASELVPLDSEVVDGTAWVSNQLCGGMDAPFIVQTGDRLAKDSFVLAGTLWLEIPG